MKHDDQRPTIIMLTASLILSLCANVYAFCFLPDKLWAEADAHTWVNIDPSYFTTGQMVAVPPIDSTEEETEISESEPTAAPKATKKPSQPTIQYEGATVYVTKSGTKFHRGSCSSLSKSKIPMLYEDAVADGYGACGKCKP